MKVRASPTLPVRLVGFMTMFAALAGCGSGPARGVGPEEDPCGSWSVCTPELALTASVEAIRTNGPSLRLSCGVDTARLEARVQSCLAGARRAAARLSDAGFGLEPIDPAALRVVVAQTCLDTFIPGKEASDCRFYSYEVNLPLAWSR